MCWSNSFIFRWKNYLQIDEVFLLQGEESSAYLITIFRSNKFNLQIKEAFHLHIEKLPTDHGIICRQKKTIDQKLIAEQQIICRLKKCLICRSKKYVQVKGILQLKNYLQRSKKNVQVKELFADWTIFCIINELFTNERIRIISI